MGKRENKITTLYHGSAFDFSKIDTTKGKTRKDFGKGFYMATGYYHARGIAIKRKRELEQKFRKNCNGYIYKIETLSQVLGDFRKGKQGSTKEYKTTGLYGKYKVKVFVGVSIDWVKFILSNRSGEINEEYDIVIGPTADSHAGKLFNQYLLGNFGEVGSESALNSLMHAIKPPKGDSRFSIQICIKNNRVAREFTILDKEVI